MARQTATNFSGPLQFPYATAATDLFKKEDVQTLALAVDGHDHSSGKGLALAAGSIPASSITSAMIVDGTIATADLADGSVTTAKHADASVTNAKLASDTARANLLTNGGFEIWQRGNGAFTTTGTYCADRWYLQLSGSDTFSVSRSGSHDAGSNYAAGAIFTLGSGGGSSAILQVQKVSDGSVQLSAKTCTASIRVNCNAANAVRLAVNSDGSGGGTVYSGFHPGGSTYQTLSVTYTVPVDATTLYCLVYFAASCTAYLDNAMLVVGSQAADYAPLHPADDLARCLRYYELLLNGNVHFLGGGAAYSSTQLLLPASYRVLKAVTPSVTVSAASDFGVFNGGAPTALTGLSASYTYADSVGMTGTVAGGLTSYWSTILQGNTANARVSVEANP